MFCTLAIISADVILYLSSSLIAQVSHPHNKAGNANLLYIFRLVCRVEVRSMLFAVVLKFLTAFDVVTLKFVIVFVAVALEFLIAFCVVMLKFYLCFML